MTAPVAIGELSAAVMLPAAVGAAVGIDNLRASAAFALLAPDRVKHALLAALVAADAFALFVGALAGSAVPSVLGDLADVVAVVVLVGLAVTAALATARPRDRSWLERHARGVVVFPVLLSLDNFAAGAAVAAVGYGSATTLLIVIVVAAGLCIVGFGLGVRLRAIGPSIRSAIGAGLFAFAAAAALLGAP